MLCKFWGCSFLRLYNTGFPCIDRIIGTAAIRRRVAAYNQSHTALGNLRIIRQTTRPHCQCNHACMPRQDAKPHNQQSEDTYLHAYMFLHSPIFSVFTMYEQKSRKLIRAISLIVFIAPKRTGSICTIWHPSFRQLLHLSNSRLFAVCIYLLYRVSKPQVSV